MPARTAILSRAALALFALVFFWQLALTNQIMVGVDIFTYFYPYRSAVNDALLQARLPLWNPYLYMGVPLLANGQAGVFYPLNWIFVALSAPLAINASIVLHVILAALFFQLFARNVLCLSEPAAFIAACVYAFSGYVGSLVEHVNQLQAAAWFPLLIYSVDRAQRGQRARHVLLGGLVFGLQLLAGHAQVSFISMVGACLWLAGRQRWVGLRPVVPVGAAARRLLTVLRALAMDLASLVGVGLLGASLAAVQLVPMLELARLSIRAGGMTYREAVAFSLPPQRLLESLLPTFGSGESISSEFIGFIGITGLALAALGVLKYARLKVGLLLLLVGGFSLALGLYDPLYFVLFKLVPAFGLFRVPARWLFLAVVAAAGFAGFGAQVVISGWRPSVHYSNRFALGAVLIAVAACVAILAGLHVLSVPAWPAVVLWMVTAVAVTLVARFAAWTRAQAPNADPGRQRMVGALVGALVLLELFAATRWLPYNQLTAPEAWSSLRPSIGFLLTDDSKQPFRVLSYSDLTWDPGDLHDIEAIFSGQLSARAIYDYTVAAKAKEIVAPNLAMRYHLQSVDGYDGGVLPLANFVGLESLLLTADQVNPDGRLRERLRSAPATRWLDLFNVRYLISDKVFDVWVDGIYYDLGMGIELPAGDGRVYSAGVPANFTATGIGVISYLSGASNLPDDTPVAELAAIDSHGATHSFILRTGRETAESIYDGASVAHDKVRAVHTLRDQPQANEYYALLTLDAPARITAVNVRGLSPTGKISLRGITLIDGASGTGQPLTLATDGKFRLAQSGDVKIYERLDPPPRALVVHRANIVGDTSEALKQMALAAFDPGSQVVLASGKELNGPPVSSAAEIAAYDAERIVVRTNDSAEGYLLIKDAWYPGWRAWVDGQLTPIERADTYFRAIYLGPGPHTVELRFEPDSLKIGALLSLVAIAAWAVAGLWIGVRHAAPGSGA